MHKAKLIGILRNGGWEIVQEQDPTLYQELIQDLAGANLSGANLAGANLSEADLGRANLSEADLSGANLSGVIQLRSTKGTTLEQLSKANYE